MKKFRVKQSARYQLEARTRRYTFQRFLNMINCPNTVLESRNLSAWDKFLAVDRIGKTTSGIL